MTRKYTRAKKRADRHADDTYVCVCVCVYDRKCARAYHLDAFGWFVRGTQGDRLARVLQSHRFRAVDANHVVVAHCAAHEMVRVPRLSHFAVQLRSTNHANEQSLN